MLKFIDSFGRVSYGGRGAPWDTPLPEFSRLLIMLLLRAAACQALLNSAVKYTEAQLDYSAHYATTGLCL